jgi:hypothetical protein
MPEFFIKDMNFVNTEIVAAKEIKQANSPLVEAMLEINPQIQAAFIKNETLLNKDMETLTPKDFGVMGHIDPTRNLLMDALNGIENLRNDFIGANSLCKKAEDLITAINAEKYIDKVDVQADYWTKLNSKKDLAIAKIPTEEKESDGSQKIIELKNVFDLSKIQKNNVASSLYSTGLFSAGSSIRNDIRDVEHLHSTLMNLQSRLKRALNRKKNELAKQDAEIPVEQRALANLNQQRLKTLADYQVVRGLVEENWNEVEKAYRRREKILSSHQGIYYARVRETPYSLAPVTENPLRFGKLEDLVPAMALRHGELPEDLEPFIESVIEIPIANWKNFNGYWDLLPNQKTLIKIMGQRKSRLDFFTQQSVSNTANKFKKMHQSQQSIMQDYARFIFNYESSLQAFNRQAAQIVSVEDLLKGYPHQLRERVQIFRNRIDQATHAVISQLHNIKPSIRLDWANAAELDQLDLRSPQLWPGLEQAKTQDLTGIRTLIELVNWWWRQLNDNASSSSVTAVRNLLRAALMVAAGDDPDEMIHGQLQFIPNGFRLGEILRVTLNRSAPIGTILQLVDDKDQLIGKLKVEDADEKGSIVSITNVYSAHQSTSSQFSVIGMKNSKVKG